MDAPLKKAVSRRISDTLVTKLPSSSRGVVSALFQKVLLSERLDASSELFGMVLAEAAAP